jgi:hypothetical protein
MHIIIFVVKARQGISVFLLLGASNYRRAAE